MRSRSILYVEDDENDVWLLERAFQAERMKGALSVVRDGLDGIAWLAGDGDCENREKYPLPQLVLLDLVLPRTGGLSVLRWIREQPSFATLLVVMFSDSYHEDDIESAYHLGANAFLQKASRPDDMREIARFLRTWLRHSLPALPARAAARSWKPETFRSVRPNRTVRFPVHLPMGAQSWGE